MKLTNRTVIFIILSVAVILRFFNYPEIPFTHDEFSALFRLQFDSFSDLIEKGIKTDGHPAGVQVFLYYWTKLFGSEAWVVKLPFTVLGILSVWLTYIIGRKWFNESVGLISSAYVASIQFTVMYSQMARPYISGLFLSLLMIYFWSNLIMNPDRNFVRNFTMYIISSALCAYNHHFSLLFAAIVGISGIFLIQRRFLMKYMLAGVLIFVLYIPHLRIFFYQLNVGGIEEWLGKPGNDFLIRFLYYVFNYSVIVILITVLIFTFGLAGIRKNEFNKKLVIISFVWFILPIVIGSVYSRYVNAVLQYSVLIFSTPMLFFLLFGFIKEQNSRINLILVSVILVANTLTLIYTRKHYEIFYTSVYEEILKDYEDIRLEGGNTIFIIDSDDRISDYYIERDSIDPGFINYSDAFQDIGAFKDYLEDNSMANDRLFLGCLSFIHPNVVPLIQDYFPAIQVQSDYPGGTTYLFSKGMDRTEKVIDFLDFESVISASWSAIDTSRVIQGEEPVRGNCYLLAGDAEWGPVFSVPLKDVIFNENNFIDISVEARSSGSLEGVVLAASLESKSKTVYWGGTDFRELEPADSASGRWQKFHHSVKMSDIDIKRDDLVLKVYIWNKDRRNLMIDNHKISLRNGNPIIYGLYEKI